MTVRFLFLVVAGAFVVVGGGCASTKSSGEEEGSGDPTSRQYEEGYRRTINTVAQSLVDIGLNVEGGREQGPSTFLITATSNARLSGEGKAMRVATIRVYINRRNRGTRVRVVTDRATRTSTLGQSSEHMQNYARALFDRVDNGLTPLPASGGQ